MLSTMTKTTTRQFADWQTMKFYPHEILQDEQDKKISLFGEGRGGERICNYFPLGVPYM